MITTAVSNNSMAQISYIALLNYSRHGSRFWEPYSRRGSHPHSRPSVLDIDIRRISIIIKNIIPKQYLPQHFKFHYA